MKVGSANDNGVDTTAGDTICGGSDEYISVTTSSYSTANVHSLLSSKVLSGKISPEFREWLKGGYTKASAVEDGKNEKNIADISDKMYYNALNREDDTENKEGNTAMPDNRIEAELLEVIKNTSNLKTTIIVTAIASVLAFAGIVVTAQIALQSSTQASFTAVQAATMENFNARKDEMEAKNNALIMKVDATLNEMNKDNEIFKGEIKNILLQNKLDEQKK